MVWNEKCFSDQQRSDVRMENVSIQMGKERRLPITNTDEARTVQRLEPDEVMKDRWLLVFGEVPRADPTIGIEGGERHELRAARPVVLRRAQRPRASAARAAHARWQLGGVAADLAQPQLQLVVRHQLHAVADACVHGQAHPAARLILHLEIPRLVITQFGQLTHLNQSSGLHRIGL